jgi:hypothetical protein
MTAGSGPDMLGAALAYAAAGIKVVPCHSPEPHAGGVRCDCRKVDCTAVGKHPRTKHGLTEASTDPDVIRAWWGRWPNANVGGIPAGAGLIAVDIDTEEHEEIARGFGLYAEPTREVLTPNGVHRYYRHPQLDKDSKLDGVVVRSGAGLVILPPSQGRNKTTGEVGAYRWADPDAAFAALPDAAAARLRDGATRAGAKERVRVAATADRIAAGGRHPALLSMAGSLLAQGIPLEIVHGLIWDMNVARCDPPKAAADVRALVDDLAAREAAKVAGTAAAPIAAPAAPAPAFAEAALYGPVGDYVRHIAPHTEAAPAALLASALAAIGALIGRGPTLWIDGAAHHPRLFVMLCGPSATGRKSTAMNRGARRLLQELDGDFLQRCTTSGLSTGEGLIDAVRDAGAETFGPTGKPLPVDAGVSDKRLLVMEDELGGVFQKLGRQGNTLSAVLRQSWDGRSLKVMTRANKLCATDPHVAVIGCITPGDLRTSLESVETSNGLANRFLFVWTDRVRLLPHGGTEPPVPHDITRALRAGVDRARRLHFLRWSDDAAALWSEVYAELSTPVAGGQLAALLARGAPQVCRVALLYAILDGAPAIERPHLVAALALWRFSADSVKYLYQSADSLSDRGRRILAALLDAGGEGLARDDIRKLLGSNAIPADVIARELAALRESGLAHTASIPTAGRPREVWRHAHFLGGGVGVGTHNSHISHISQPYTDNHTAGGGPGLESFAWDGRTDNAA